MSYEKLDHSYLKILPLSHRQNKTSVKDILSLDFVSDYKNLDLDALISEIIKAKKSGGQIIWMIGAHVLRRGCARIIIDLLERGFITHLATNAAVAIHDFEMAYQGATLEDVEFYIKDGKFGNWDETGRYINEAITQGCQMGIGLGESIGLMIKNRWYDSMPFLGVSIFATAIRLGIPVTVHKGIGYDITDQHPSANFAAIGKTSGDDFLIFANSISKLENGVFLNLGSSVMGPEVYLKALSIARNLTVQKGHEIRHFTTGVFDLVPLGDWQNEDGIVDYKKPGRMSDPRYYFRPLKSILIRTVMDGGRSYYIQGDFKDTVSALYKKIKDMHAMPII